VTDFRTKLTTIICQSVFSWRDFIVLRQYRAFWRLEGPQARRIPGIPGINTVSGRSPLLPFGGHLPGAFRHPCQPQEKLIYKVGLAVPSLPTDTKGECDHPRSCLQSRPSLQRVRRPGGGRSAGSAAAAARLYAPAAARSVARQRPGRAMAGHSDKL
jgi:hypothetical protein